MQYRAILFFPSFYSVRFRTDLRQREESIGSRRLAFRPCSHFSRPCSTSTSYCIRQRSRASLRLITVSSSSPSSTTSSHVIMFLCDSVFCTLTCRYLYELSWALFFKQLALGLFFTPEVSTRHIPGLLTRSSSLSTFSKMADFLLFFPFSRKCARELHLSCRVIHRRSAPIIIIKQRKRSSRCGQSKPPTLPVSLPFFS